MRKPRNSLETLGYLFKLISDSNEPENELHQCNGSICLGVYKVYKLLDLIVTNTIAET